MTQTDVEGPRIVDVAARRAFEFAVSKRAFAQTELTADAVGHPAAAEVFVKRSVQTVLRGRPVSFTEEVVGIPTTPKPKIPGSLPGNGRLRSSCAARPRKNGAPTSIASASRRSTRSRPPSPCKRGCFASLHGNFLVPKTFRLAPARALPRPGGAFVKQRPGTSGPLLFWAMYSFPSLPST